MRTIAIALPLGVFIVFLVAAAFLMRPFGYPTPPAEGYVMMDDYIIENAQPETGANNVVTAVLFDYRGFDTLGEVIILFAAVTGVGMLFRRQSFDRSAVKREEGLGEPSASPPVSARGANYV